MRRSTAALLFGLLTIAVATGTAANAQKNPKDTRSGYDRSARATLVHPAIVYVAADDNAQHISEVLPGHEVVVIERNGAWVRVFANTDIPDEQADDQKPEFSADETVTPASGWIHDKGIVTPATANGDTILYGTAANFEEQAEQPHAPKDAAEEAHLLYRRVADYFPNSALAPEAAWRAADIEWQIQKADAASRPSARERDPYMRDQMDEEEMKKVVHNFPHTRQGDLAAYDLIDNKLCGDWQGQEKCPEKEADIYEKYAAEHPDGPRTAQALYQAVYRECVLVDMFHADQNDKKADEAKARARDLGARLRDKFPQSDLTARATALVFKIDQGVPVYGIDQQ